MSTRLQVVLQEEEFEQIRAAAAQEKLTVSEWVRRELRRARLERPVIDSARKLAAVRAAARHEFPTADIDEVLSDIERGYLGK